MRLNSVLLPRLVSVKQRCPFSFPSLASTCLPLAVLQQRCVVELNCGASVLGTDSFGSDFLSTVKQDLLELEDPEGRMSLGQTMTSCIRKGELDHMESPEADALRQAKTDVAIDSFFSKLPDIGDEKRAMQLALQKTPEEQKDHEAVELVREVMREKYQRMRGRRRAEHNRIEAAMELVAAGKHSSQRGETPTDMQHDTSLTTRADSAMDTRMKQQQQQHQIENGDEVAALKAQIEALKAQLRAQQDVKEEK